MIYSCIEYKTEGANGTTLYPKAKEDNTLVLIGKKDGRNYYVGLADEEQHQEIDFKQESMSPDIDEMIKTSQFSSAIKQSVRSQIHKEVGDTEDLIADQGKMIEFLLMLTCRMAEEYLGGEPIPTDTKADYLGRVHAILNAVDSDAILLRTQLEDTDAMVNRLMSKQNNINHIVEDTYLKKIKDLVNAV